MEPEDFGFTQEQAAPKPQIEITHTSVDGRQWVFSMKPDITEVGCCDIPTEVLVGDEGIIVYDVEIVSKDEYVKALLENAMRTDGTFTEKMINTERKKYDAGKDILKDAATMLLGG